jgi:hypothetical protein
VNSCYLHWLGNNDKKNGLLISTDELFFNIFDLRLAKSVGVVIPAHKGWSMLLFASYTSKVIFKLGMAVHAWNPSTLEIEAEGSWVPGWPGIQSKTLSLKKKEAMEIYFLKSTLLPCCKWTLFSLSLFSLSYSIWILLISFFSIFNSMADGNK